MFRPPTIVIWLSAVIDLLCMRRLTRGKLISNSARRRTPERCVYGLKSRTSMFGWSAILASHAAYPSTGRPSYLSLK